MAMKNSEIFHVSRKLIRAGDTEKLLVISRDLIESDDDASRASGYLLQGIAYELGGKNANLASALDSYRRASTISPDYVPFLYMARVCMKRGNGGYPEAYGHLLNALSIGSAPELDLALGHYFETKENPEYAVARKHYVRAATQGRFQGFFGYSRISRQLKQPFRAVAVDVLRVCLSPLFLIILGARASKGF